MEELEKRGVVGPAKAGAAREILIGEKGEAKAAPPTTPAAPSLELVEMPGRLALVRLYEQLTLTPEGAAKLASKRGLSEATIKTLGFVSSPKSNRDILNALADDFPIDDLLASGLWVPSDRKRNMEARPNSQFAGYGQVGKKPKEDRRSRDDKWIWGWMDQVILPYFDEFGRLVKLRPHKGGAAKDTLAGQTRDSNGGTTQRERQTPDRGSAS